jgi:hypothetical protein
LSLYYFGLKIAFFFGLVRCFARFDVLHKYVVFLAALYTAGVAFLSWVFLISPGMWRPTQQQWGIWLAVTFAITLVYFKLLDRFDEGFLFWILLALGCVVVLY